MMMGLDWVRAKQASPWAWTAARMRLKPRRHSARFTLGFLFLVSGFSSSSCGRRRTCTPRSGTDSRRHRPSRPHPQFPRRDGFVASLRELVLREGGFPDCLPLGYLGSGDCLGAPVNCLGWGLGPPPDGGLEPIAACEVAPRPPPPPFAPSAPSA